MRLRDELLHTDVYTLRDFRRRTRISRERVQKADAKPLHVNICRCKVADVKMQVEIHFLKTPTPSNKFSTFSPMAAGQRGLMPQENATLSHFDCPKLR